MTTASDNASVHLSSEGRFRVKSKGRQPMTDTPGTLEERLRKQARRRSSRSSETLEYLAADEIASLRARVEVMREALTEIAHNDPSDVHWAIARQALKDSDNAE